MYNSVQQYDYLSLLAAEVAVVVVAVAVDL
jgi:hypothetical protein